MKNWLKFFFFSFFSNKRSKEGVKRGYTNLFLSLILALIYLCIGVIGADVLPFSSQYNNATSFKSMVRVAFMDPTSAYGINILFEDGKIKATRGGEFDNALIINTFADENQAINYSNDGYKLVVDTRPADTLAEVEAYCVSTDSEKTVISYADYLTLNEVARKNFEFKLKYTGGELKLDDNLVEDFKAYLEGASEETKSSISELSSKLEREEITKTQYNRDIYELYFSEYYPSISEYETTSKVPLLRNYYFHELIGKGEDKFLMVFDDCMVGSFETDGKMDVFFYGFYSCFSDGKLIEGYFPPEGQVRAVDDFIKNSFMETVDLSTYIYIMNTIRLVPIIALMVIVVAMLMHSILSLKGVETCKTFGASLKIVGVYLWWTGLITAILTVIISFMVERSLITVVSIVAFFITLLVRTSIFMIAEIKERKIQLEKLSAEEVNTEA
ncbi:MAG: hypothetical protein IJW43_03460 [Clostridia bacterium]|nr:hypothetical protein [Clostridia bacterium]